MPFVQMISPTGSPIVAAAETVPCFPGIDGIDPETGEVDYDGSGSKMDWDGQTPKLDENGEKVFLDDDGSMWPFSQLTQKPAGEEPEEEAEKSVVIKVDETEHATILAALRYWQKDVEADGENFEFGDFWEGKTPLTPGQIDDLCERIN